MQFNSKPRLIAVAISSLFLLGLAHVAKADSTDDLLKKLRDKGVLTEQEYDEFNSTRDTEKVKKNSEIKASFKDGIVWESGDRSTSFQVSGRLHADYRWFSRNVDNANANPAGSQTGAAEADTFDIRRARIELKGKFYDSYEFLVSADLASPSAGNTGSILDQAYMNINWWKETQFRFGQFKSPMELEKMTSSNFIDFQERSVVNQLAPNEDRGAMVWGLPYDGITYALAVMTGEGSKNRNDADLRVDGVEYVGRGTVNFAEIFGDKSNQVWHFGASASTTDLVKTNLGANNGWLNGGNALRTEPRGLSYLTLPTVTAVNGVANAVEKTRLAGEVALAQGPFKVQAEWMRNSFEGDNSNTSHFNKDIDAWYVEGLWLITGESYASAYKDGAFGNIKPKNDFVHPEAAINTGAYGAVEVGARFSRLDAKDFADWATATGTAGVAGTATANVANTIDLRQNTLAADTWTLGLKWILNPNSRMEINYVRTKFDTPITIFGTQHSDEDAVTVRTQWNF